MVDIFFPSSSPSFSTLLAELSPRVPIHCMNSGGGALGLGEEVVLGRAERYCLATVAKDTDWLQ